MARCVIGIGEDVEKNYVSNCKQDDLQSIENLIRFFSYA